MKLLHVLYAADILLLLALAGCRIRVPPTGCPYEDEEVSPQFVTPWGTVLEEDIAALTGPFPGSLTWLDGDDVITVPKAGQRIGVEAELEFDLPTATLRKYTKDPNRGRACEPDRVFVDAELSFVRLEDGEIELSVPIVVYRDVEPDQYFGEAETPVADFAPDLVPIEEHESQGISTSMVWAHTGNLHADFTFHGQTNDSPTTGHGSFRRVAEFVPEQ